MLFYVKDTGIGIFKGKTGALFLKDLCRPIVLLHENTADQDLGLAISKGLVELLGGKMWAESTVECGSTFYFTLPYVPAVNQEDEDPGKKETRKQIIIGKGRLFLIAEDDKFSYKFLEGFLKQTRADVIACC